MLAEHLQGVSYSAWGLDRQRKVALVENEFARELTPERDLSYSVARGTEVV